MSQKKQQSPKESKPRRQSQRGSSTESGLPMEQAKGITKAVAFLKDMLGKEGNVIKADKTDKGWEVEVEVIEQSEYMKKIGISKPVYDKNVYRVILDQNFEMVSYERKGQKPYGSPAE